MTGKRIEDLINVETEHMVGSMITPYVKLRAESEQTLLLGQLTPVMAREIAQHLMEAAARCEYEADLLSEMKKAEFEDDTIAALFAMVRAGEMRRHTQLG